MTASDRYDCLVELPMTLPRPTPAKPQKKIQSPPPPLDTPSLKTYQASTYIL
jgi:hypothetical protein